MIRKSRETTKARIVYDGSAKSSTEERSLNECLETGTNHIPLIFSMLVNFRANPIGLTADIEKAFLMIGIKEEDRHMLRFLWFKDPTASSPEIIQLSFNRLVFGLRPSPSLLGETVRHYLRLYRMSDPELAELLENSLYVDDLISGSDTVEGAYNIYKKSKQNMAEGGFNLRKWRSNSQELCYRISKTEMSTDLLTSDRVQQDTQTKDRIVEDVELYAKSSIGLGNSNDTQENVVKVLGQNWNIDSD